MDEDWIKVQYSCMKHFLPRDSFCDFPFPLSFFSLCVCQSFISHYVLQVTQRFLALTDKKLHPPSTTLQNSTAEPDWTSATLLWDSWWSANVTQTMNGKCEDVFSPHVSGACSPVLVFPLCPGLTSVSLVSFLELSFACLSLFGLWFSSLELAACLHVSLHNIAKSVAVFMQLGPQI